MPAYSEYNMICHTLSPLDALTVGRIGRVDAMAVARLLAQAEPAIAAFVEAMKAHQPAEIEASIRLRYAAIGELAHPHGAMFVPCLHRRGPAQQEDLGRRAARIQIARPVVPDLVIVERRPESRGGKRGPQIGLDLVERVAPPAGRGAGR